MVPMLMVAWREMISGDSGFSVEKSIVLGSGCSLGGVSLSEAALSYSEILRELRALDGRQDFSRLLQRWLWLRLLNLLLLRHAFVIAVVVLGLGIHAGW
jgi:hypothetical protein